MPKTKRVLILSDFHCGHEVGLTPPKWNVGQTDDPMVGYRSTLWSRFKDLLRDVGKPDILVLNGDVGGYARWRGMSGCYITETCGNTRTGLLRFPVT